MFHHIHPNLEGIAPLIYTGKMALTTLCYNPDAPPRSLFLCYKYYKLSVLTSLAPVRAYERALGTIGTPATVTLRKHQGRQRSLAQLVYYKK